MRALPLALSAVAIGLLGVLVLGRGQDTEAAPLAFLETFDGAPVAPGVFSSPHWDVQVHERGQRERAFGWMPAMQAQHTDSCGAPPGTHLVDSVEESVFRCSDHVMTSVNGGGYGLIYLTPDHMIDWSSGSAVLQWDMSTEKMSTRDWPDITITPWADQMAVPLASGLAQGVDLQGPPRNMVHVGCDYNQGFCSLEVRRDGSTQEFGTGSPLGSGIAPGTNQAAVRQTFRLTITPTSARFERLASATAPALTFWTRTFAPLPFSSGIVQLGHHSYSPDKDGAGVPATWHWDNVRIEPAIPFTMTQVNQRSVAGDAPRTVTFAAPAPSGAFLRFAAWGSVRVNGAECAPVKPHQKYEHANSYNCPVPAGSTSAVVDLGTVGWYTCGFGCLAKDFSLWSLNGGAPSQTNTPNPSPTSTPSGTAPPTATATSTATPTPTPSPTASSTPTSTPTATASPTSTPETACMRVRGSFPSGSGWQSERWLYTSDPELCSAFRASP